MTATFLSMHSPRVIVDRTAAGHLVTMDPMLVLQARIAIRLRRANEARERKAA